MDDKIRVLMQENGDLKAEMESMDNSYDPEEVNQSL